MNYVNWKGATRADIEGTGETKETNGGTPSDLFETETQKDREENEVSDTSDDEDGQLEKWAKDGVNMDTMDGMQMSGGGMKYGEMDGRSSMSVSGSGSNSGGYRSSVNTNSGSIEMHDMNRDGPIALPDHTRFMSSTVEMETDGVIGDAVIMSDV